MLSFDSTAFSVSIWLHKINLHLLHGSLSAASNARNVGA